MNTMYLMGIYRIFIIAKCTVHFLSSLLISALNFKYDFKFNEIMFEHFVTCRYDIRHTLNHFMFKLQLSNYS